MRRPGILPERVPAIEVVPASIMAPFDFLQLFPHAAPVEIDLGCGDGAFLIALARENPQRNYLGIDRMLGRVRSACKRAANLQLQNVRVLRLETTYAVARLIPAASVFQFHLLFPDPWPKRRHHRRRTVTSEFVAAIHRALTPNSLLHIATDDAEYFSEIKRLARPLFDVATMDKAFPLSTFGQRFAEGGAQIHRVLLRKTSPVR